VILANDEPTFRERATTPSGVRLLPSGDNFVLRWGDERTVQVGDPDHRADLWTSRVWPGAVLVDGELVGTWRRSGESMTIIRWRHLDDETQRKIDIEASRLPLANLGRGIVPEWRSVTDGG
jgi:hypothetical protein